MCVSRFHNLASQHGIEIFSASLFEIEQSIINKSSEGSTLTFPLLDSNTGRCNTFSYKSAAEDLALQRSQVAANMYLNGASLEDIRIALERLKNSKPSIDPKTKLPVHLHKWLNVFSHASANELSPHRDWDHKIDLQPGKKPPFGPLYNMSVEELQVL